MGIGRDITEIVALIIGVALVGLIIGHAGGTATVLTAGSSALNNLLKTATLQGGGGFDIQSVAPISFNG
jgi:hypothetical protein